MNQNKQYKWIILALVVATNMLLVAIPSMAISVLAEEISANFNLTLVQMGIVWGAGSLLGIATGLLSGVMIDKIGPKKIMIFAGLLAGVVGAARGFTFDFYSLTFCVFLFGAMVPFITNNGFKLSGMWFPPKQLGLANGIISMGMALGFLLGAFLSAAVLSPIMGGWRNVLILYGVLGVLVSLLWILTNPIPPHLAELGLEEETSVKKSFIHVMKQKNVWMLGLILFGVSGGVQGFLGYFPTYLRGLGWSAVNADGALSSFHFASMLLVLPIAILSDRLKSRKNLLMVTGIIIAAGMVWVCFAQGGIIWAAVIFTGMMRDGFMAILLTMIVEVNGIGPKYAGTATGLVIAFSGLGNFLSPPIGNSLANLGTGIPFLFWAGLILLGMLVLSLTKTNSSAPVGILETQLGENTAAD